MNPRNGLVVGGVMAAAVAVVLAVAPTAWLADMLKVAGDDLVPFLVRRYAASATVALAVVAIAIVRRTEARKAVLLGFSTWFAVQAITAWWAVASGIAGGFAWAAVVADPLFATWFLMLMRTRTGSTASPANIQVANRPSPQ